MKVFSLGQIDFGRLGVILRAASCAFGQFFKIGGVSQDFA